MVANKNKRQLGAKISQNLSVILLSMVNFWMQDYEEFKLSTKNFGQHWQDVKDGIVGFLFTQGEEGTIELSRPKGLTDDRLKAVILGCTKSLEEGKTFAPHSSKTAKNFNLGIKFLEEAVNEWESFVSENEGEDVPQVEWWNAYQENVEKLAELEVEETPPAKAEKPAPKAEPKVQSKNGQQKSQSSTTPEKALPKNSVKTSSETIISTVLLFDILAGEYGTLKRDELAKWMQNPKNAVNLVGAVPPPFVFFEK